MTDSLIERFRQGDRLALSRLLSQAARGENLQAIATQIERPAKPARVVAITGSGGVGKSTLVGKLIEIIRNAGLRVAVLACDPESPVSGGAILGDRFRMPSRPDDDGVFIRSLAAASGTGAVAEHLPLMVRLCQAFGFDIVLIETVGAGQSETGVFGLADLVVLLVQPETGDDLQWEKAGVFEIADIVAVNKADLPGADQAVAQIRAAVELSARPALVLRVSGKTGEGVSELWQAMHTAAPHRPALGARELLRSAQQVLAERFASAARANDPQLRELGERVRNGSLSMEEAGGQLLALLQRLEPASRK